MTIKHRATETQSYRSIASQVPLLRSVAWVSLVGGADETFDCANVLRAIRRLWWCFLNFTAGGLLPLVYGLSVLSWNVGTSAARSGWNKKGTYNGSENCLSQTHCIHPSCPSSLQARHLYISRLHSPRFLSMNPERSLHPSGLDKFIISISQDLPSVRTSSTSELTIGDLRWIGAAICLVAYDAITTHIEDFHFSFRTAVFGNATLRMSVNKRSRELPPRHTSQ